MLEEKHGQQFSNFEREAIMSNGAKGSSYGSKDASKRRDKSNEGGESLAFGLGRDRS